MRAAGPRAGGPRRQWYQDVPLDQFDIVGAPDVAVTVGGRRRALAQGTDVAVRASMRNVDRVAIANAPLVFLGYGVRAPERRWDDFKGQDLRGKVGSCSSTTPTSRPGRATSAARR
jgi:hypothetical protein